MNASLNIGIIGKGVVGSSLARWFKEYTRHLVSINDPQQGYYDSVKYCDATFICVPAPTKPNGEQDYEMIEDAISKSGGVTFIRSTVLPGTNDRYKTFACPEFLTQRTAYSDTCEMDILSGYTDYDFMRNLFTEKPLLLMSNVECEIAKYAHNAFGAIKVNFFNLIYNLCEMRQADYERVINGILMSGYINPIHTKVPGPDKGFGFGGACFPKDLKAFHHFYPTQTFAACLSENKLHRGKQA